MQPVVQAKCPACKKVLRIPADWVNQALKCKHCGAVMQARPQAENGTVQPAAARVKNTAPPKGRTVQPAAPPPTPADGNPFAGLTTPVTAPPVSAKPRTAAPSPRPKKAGVNKPSGGCLVVAGLLAGVTLVIGVAAFFLVPYVVPKLEQLFAGGAPSPDIPNDNGSGRPETPRTQRTPLKGSFPNRRALIVGINNYLYFNPTLYGSLGVPQHTIGTLADRISAGFHVSRDRTVLLCDAGPSQVAKPTLAVVQQTIENFLSTCREQDCALLIFEGHAVEAGDAKEICLVPYDGALEGKDLAPVLETLLPLKWLYEQLEKCPARQKLLVLDTCRFNPARGYERPASNPAEPADGKEGTLWPALMQMLEKTPKETQIWVSCSTDQQSYEIEDEVHDSVFFQALGEQLKAEEDKVQYPEEPLPADGRLVDAVNQRMKNVLAPRQKQQVSRLLGSCRDGGITYDPNETAPRSIAVKPPAVDGGAAKLDDVKKLFAEIDMPPVRGGASPENVLKPEMMPTFSAKRLAEFGPADESTPFRQAVEKARDLLRNRPPPAVLPEAFKAPGEGMDTKFKEDINNKQKEVANIITRYGKVLAELKQLEAEKDKAPKRWQAHYLYVRAYLEMYLAYLYEYTSALGSMRKELPDRDKMQNGWRLAAKSKLEGDNEGKKLAKACRSRFDSVAEEFKDTPWEVLARREKLTAIGLEWQGAVVP